MNPSDKSLKASDKILIGITGRAGSGKSTFARMLAEGRAMCLDADKIAWELYRNPTIHKNLLETFGKKIFTNEGAVDRKLLGKLAFSDPEKLRQLNSIIHPALIGELKHRIAQSPQRVVIIDAALLLDWNIGSECDLLIALESSENLLLERLADKKIGAKYARLILETQCSDEEFRRICHLIIENNGDLNELKLKADKTWQRMIGPLLKE
jgi:dephospho-CoA kinase